MLKVIELFAGVGAQREALRRINLEHEVVGISEIDKYALIAYEKLHGKTKNFGDISKIDKLPNADLWTYSFPCTDISLAGRQRGFEKGSNTHSSLLWEVQRLLLVAKENNELPKYLLLENVKQIISEKFMPLFQVWLDFLKTLGYKNYYQVLNAKDYGIPQNRERVFVVSIRDKDDYYIFPKKQKLELKLKDLLEEKVDEKYYLSSKLIECFASIDNKWKRGLFWKPLSKESGYAFTIKTRAGQQPEDNYIYEPVIVSQTFQSVEGGVQSSQQQKDNFVVVPQKTKDGYSIAEVGDGIYTDRCQVKRGVVQKSKIPTLKTSSSDIAVVVPKDELIAIRRLTPRECWRLMGWQDERIDEVMNMKELSNTQLYKMAGNSIVVNCLMAIFEKLFIEKEEGEYFEQLTLFEFMEGETK